MLSCSFKAFEWSPWRLHPIHKYYRNVLTFCSVSSASLTVWTIKMRKIQKKNCPFDHANNFWNMPWPVSVVCVNIWKSGIRNKCKQTHVSGKVRRDITKAINMPLSCIGNVYARFAVMMNLGSIRGEKNLWHLFLSLGTKNLKNRAWYGNCKI